MNYTIQQLANRTGLKRHQIDYWMRKCDITRERKGTRQGGIELVIPDEEGERLLRELREYRRRREGKPNLSDKHPRMYHSVGRQFLTDQEWVHIQVVDRFVRMGWKDMEEAA